MLPFWIVCHYGSTTNMSVVVECWAQSYADALAGVIARGYVPLRSQ